MNNGSCLCGDITWKIEGTPFMMSNCHCSMCRKLHGSACGTYVGVLPDAFCWTGGVDKIRIYTSSAAGHRSFCPRCGSKVAAAMGDGQSVFMPAGNLDGKINRKLDSHVFVASKAVWFEITDDVEQFEAYPEMAGIVGIENPERQPETAGAIGGSCLCGKVLFEFDETLGRMGYCHCSRCRKSRSAAHSVQTFVEVDKFRWVSGESLVENFKLPDSESFFSSFCRDCGSMMPTVHEDRGIAMVPMGAVDQDPGIRPQAHIYTGSKASWFEITDDLPQYQAMP
ncbi:MAG: GFA family protein [bacterium]|nr:GFA family protein [Gammaproteobacteria bacterium]HIL98849.1 GFA family protein [Pseudomonadales bacterium]